MGIDVWNESLKFRLEATLWSWDKGLKFRLEIETEGWNSKSKLKFYFEFQVRSWILML